MTGALRYGGAVPRFLWGFQNLEALIRGHLSQKRDLFGEKKTLTATYATGMRKKIITSTVHNENHAPPRRKKWPIIFFFSDHFGLFKEPCLSGKKKKGQCNLSVGSALTLWPVFFLKKEKTGVRFLGAA